MPKTFTEQTFRSTYKDDYKDSDNYSRILFNAGRALQARELTQMQTIIQKEISRFADNIFQKDGVPVSAGGVSINDAYSFIKIQADQNNSFDDVTALKGVVLTGQTSNIKVRVQEAVAATEGGDPDTLYVQYLDNPNTQSSSVDYKVNRRVTLGETLSNGSNVNLTVQTVDTTTNPALGFGSTISIGESTFYVSGHFVFVPKQTIFLGKYLNKQSADIGFKLVKDVVTVSDTDALYDNQNVTPNRSSPGADRYRIRLVLTRKQDFTSSDSFVYFARVVAGQITHQVGSTDGYNEIKKFVNTRVKEINGDFIKKYWKLRFEPNANISSDYLMMKIDPGTAYIDGHRAATTYTQSMPLRKAKDTIIDEDEQVGIDYGNFYYWDSGVGMLDIDTCENVDLYSGFDGTGTKIGVANIRALTEGTSSLRVKGYTYGRQPLYKAHLFNVNRTNLNFTLEDVKSIKSNSNSHLINLVQAINNQGSILHEPRKTALLFDTPLRRPKSFTDVTYTFMKKFTFSTGAGATTHTLNLTDSGETFVNEADIMIASDTEFAPSGASGDIQSGNQSILFSGLTQNTSYEVICQVKKTNAEVKTKTLTETTITANIEEEGNGIKVLNLGKSDIYSIERVRIDDSDGEDIFPHFMFDAGGKMTHYDDGRLIWSGGGLDSESQDVFIRFKYFEPSTSGQFYAVNSYDGQVDYLKVPAQKLPGGQAKVSLRDTIDFRPSTDGSGSYTTVPPLPVPTQTIATKAEYYLPRNDRLVISKDAELRLIEGSPSLNPKFPEIPEDCIDLYKIRLNPNTLHARDLKTTLIPRKGYTMADINKLEEKLDRLEEMTVLSLLELNTKFLKVLDSDGNDRTKVGFFVDNFKNHAYSDVKGAEYRASIDKRKNYMRPKFVEDAVSLLYDSENTSQLRTRITGDMVTLDYNEVPWQAQELASGTENLAPFFVPTVIGNLTLSPETADFFDTEIVGEKVLGTTSEFDLTHAKNWNNSENEWYGIDPSTLDVGDTARSFVSGTNTSVSHDSKDPILIGRDVTEDLGEWVEVGHVTDEEVLSTETVEVSRERVSEEVSRTTLDAWWNYMGYWYEDWNYEFYNGQYWGWSGIWNGYYYWWSVDEVTTDHWDVVTRETRDTVKTTNTTTYEQTTTILTENTYEGTAEITTTTTTSNTVNRIASESTIRDVVGTKVVDLSVIPFMHSIEIQFKAEGLRPNTQYFPYFDKTNVSSFCREVTSFLNANQRNVNNANAGERADGNGIMQTGQAHSAGSTNLVSDAEGTIIGSFEVPNNVAMRFHTGKREFLLNDVNSPEMAGNLSFARAVFESNGVLEHREEEVYITRVLKVVGDVTQDVDRDVEVKKTTWTETLVDTEVATDVKSSSTTSTVVTGTSTTEENQETVVTYESEYLNSIQPVDHTDTDNDDTPPGGGTDDTPDGTPKGGQNYQNELDNAIAEQTIASGTQQRPSSDYRYGDYADVYENVYLDPVAQTFAVERNGGITLTSVEVYFSSKSADAPVFCEIRPTVQGQPSSGKMFASKKLSPSQVNLVPDGANNKTMLKNGTTFTFDEPVFLSKGEYALVLRPGNNDPNYNVYVAEVGQNAIGSTETFIGQQPTLGVFFKSQNSRFWEPCSNIDLAYRLNVAQFKSSGNAILENVNVPPAPLTRDPLIVDSGSNIVRVMLTGHGLRDGDKTIIRGIDSAENFGNGLTGADVNGMRTVIKFDNSGYTYQADATANKRKWFGGQSVTSSRHVNYDVLRPSLGITQPGSTNVTLSMKGTTQSALAGSQTRFTKDAKFQLVENEKSIRYKQPRAIFNRPTENLTGAGKLEGKRSATVQVTMKTTDPFVSPIIDMERASLNCVHNLISKQTDGIASTTKTITFANYDSGEDLGLILTSTDARVPTTKFTNNYVSGVGVAANFDGTYGGGFVLQSTDDSDELTISRSDGKAFSIGIDSDNTTGTWSLTDGSTTIQSTDHSTTIDVSANAQSEVDGFNIPLTYIAESNPRYGSESAKHVTKVTTLAEDAVGLKIFVAANRPPEANFQVWWRTSTGGESISSNAWNLVSPIEDRQPDTNPNIFREYEYLVGGDGGTLVKFTQFQVKIVMQSTNSAQVPTFRDLRAIALAT